MNPTRWLRVGPSKGMSSRLNVCWLTSQQRYAAHRGLVSPSWLVHVGPRLQYAYRLDATLVEDFEKHISERLMFFFH